MGNTYSGIPCKTFVEGKGWLYAWQMEEPKFEPRTPQERVDAIFSRIDTKNLTTEQLSGDNAPLKSYSQTWDEIRADKCKL